MYGFHGGGETDGAGLPGVTEPHEELLPTHRKAYMPSSGLIWRQSTGTSVYIYRPTTLALVFENMEMKVLKYSMKGNCVTLPPSQYTQSQWLRESVLDLFRDSNTKLDRNTEHGNKNHSSHLDFILASGGSGSMVFQSSDTGLIAEE